MRVVIVGGGSAGWMAAAMLSRMMGRQLDITLVESDDIATVGVGEATIPPIQHFNRVLGISETDFLRETGGTFKLGIEFENWLEQGHCYMHAFGGLGKEMGLSPFHHSWLRAVAHGRNDSLWDFSLNYQAAKANKFQPLSSIPNTKLPGLVHAYHFDAGLYAKYLSKLSRGWGVKRVEGLIEQVNLRQVDGAIESLRLRSGEQVEADLYIDCSGFRSLLLGSALKVEFEDWRHWLPCDRAMAVPSERIAPLQPYTRSTAHRAGWRWRIPLQHRTGNGLVYCSEYLTEEQASVLLMEQLDAPALAEPRLIHFTTGRRKQQWHKNCVALGLASGFLEPLESTSLHLVQSGIVRLLKLFPRQGWVQQEIDEFNRQSQTEFEQIRDFIILHYALNRREEPFWQRCRDMPIPESLSQKLALFAKTGKVFREQDELFTEVAWQQVMLGQGIQPEAYHPMADALSEAQLNELLDSLRTIFAGTVQRLPAHDEFINSYCASSSTFC
ncbi:tryptophan halogenase family protein [Bowmanella pacifica]|uniref:Tryptophan halogenase n=1 Tax=Bowmanella pacifica TaxID=502051 RepID=A0A917YTQ3_9ALTE|nr:tryptophan halogenase family protein [Bowmanella pacifica]GGO64024.1 tryptophan halogenase [Bowmanella pacifica]